jgi:hypothetical protein
MGSSFTLKDIGSDTADSDVNPSGSHLGFTDIINIASNVISMSSIDAGLKVVGATQLLHLHHLVQSGYFYR